MTLPVGTPPIHFCNTRKERLGVQSTGSPFARKHILQVHKPDRITRKELQLVVATNCNTSNGTAFLGRAVLYVCARAQAEDDLRK